MSKSIPYSDDEEEVFVELSVVQRRCLMHSIRVHSPNILSSEHLDILGCSRIYFAQLVEIKSSCLTVKGINSSYKAAVDSSREH